MHYSTIDETERNPKPHVIHHRRRFWHGERAEAHIETILRRPKSHFAAVFHVGNAGSETPFDGHLILFGSGFYWGTSIGRKLAQRLTETKEHRYDSRDIGFTIYEGTFRISAWTPRDRWTRGEFARWRTGHFSMNPLDWFLGPKKYSYTNLDTAHVDLQLPDGKYPAVLTLQHCTLRRTRGRILSKTTVVDVDVPNGVPTEQDSWKGGSTYGFGVTIHTNGNRQGWSTSAKQAAEAWVLNQRARRDYQPATS